MTAYVNLSGGKDSTALAVYLDKKGVDFKLLFADTMAEFPETYMTLSKVANALGKELVIAPSKGFFYYLSKYGYMLPDFRRRYCTRLLKQEVLDEVLNEDDISYVGITADESHRLEGLEKPYQLERPFVDDDISSLEVKELCGDLLNPIYKWRSSCSCFCCPFQKKGDWVHMLENHPQFYRLAEQWEDLSLSFGKGFSFRKEITLKEMREKYQSQGKLFVLEDEPELYESCAWCAY